MNYALVLMVAFTLLVLITSGPPPKNP